MLASAGMLATVKIPATAVMPITKGRQKEHNAAGKPKR